MPGESEWAVPVLIGKAIEHRSKIEEIWNNVSNWLLGEKRSIAFTGMPGIGKTVLFEHVSGAAYRPGYRYPEPSVAAESGKIPSAKKRLRVTVVPGDQSTPRLEALEDLFNGKHTVDGIVHVVAYGFAEVRDEFAREALVKEGKLETLEQFLQQQKAAELADLEQTCDLIRNAKREIGKPKWMLVAATKVDLFQDSLDEVRRYYSPHGDSLFTSRLQKLMSQVGSDNFRWDARPVCSCIEDFTWNTETRNSTLNNEQRDAYVANFAKALEHFCG